MLCGMFTGADMVGMAKRLTHRIVAPARMGSIPITHPILGRGQAVRQRVLAPSCVGSNPAAPAKVAMPRGRGAGTRPHFFYLRTWRNGRRTRLRIWRVIVRVQVPPSAPEKPTCFDKSVFQLNPPLRVGEILLRNVKSSLRSGEIAVR